MRYLTHELASGRHLPRVSGVQAGWRGAIPWSKGPAAREGPGKRPGDWELEPTGVREHVRCWASETPVFFADGSYTARRRRSLPCAQDPG